MRSQANGSTANFRHVNITSHNGAANTYSHGTDTVVNVENAWLYSSGPVAHGVYASGNGTIIGRNIEHFSGGYRSSSCSGDSPEEIVQVYDSVAHTTGIGSATFYALGEIYAHNVLSLNEKAPVMFMDDAQNATLVNWNCTAGLLAGTIMFSSATRTFGANLKLVSSQINVLGKTEPALWFGNINADAVVESSKLNPESGIHVVANYSQVTQTFDYYASYTNNNDLLPAEVTVKVKDSTLQGDLVAYNKGTISWDLSDYSSWTGKAMSGYGEAYFDVSLDETSKWVMTGDTTVQNLSDKDTTMSNIHSDGYTLCYNSSAVLSRWFRRKTHHLPGGSRAIPIGKDKCKYI